MMYTKQRKLPSLHTEYPNVKDLGGYVVDVRRLVVPTNKNWSAFNPSIAFHPRKGYAMTVRSSNYVVTDRGEYKVVDGGLIKSQVWFSELDSDLKLKDLRKIDLSGIKPELSRGLEDAKLFVRDGKWMFSCVVMENHTPLARMAIATMDAKGTKVTDLKILPSIDAGRIEKNWMIPSDPNPNFDFIYGPNQIVKGDQIIAWMTDQPDISALRGGSNLLSMGDGSYLAVTHRMFGKQDSFFQPETFGMVHTDRREYVHYFVKYDEKGIIRAMSKGFIFYKPGIEFAAGLTARKKELLISFGREDVSSHIAVMPYETVLKSLHPIVY
jgi:hypothetical protein